MNDDQYHPLLSGAWRGISHAAPDEKKRMISTMISGSALAAKFQDKESPEDCLLRETWEGDGADADQLPLSRAGDVHLQPMADRVYASVHGRRLDGEPHPCDEGELAWIKKADLLSLPLWKGDQIFWTFWTGTRHFFSLKPGMRETIWFWRYSMESVSCDRRGGCMPQCKLDVTLEPLSAAYLNQVERLWSDPAVIRYTSIRTPCTREAAAERLSNLSGRPTVFAVLHAGKFCGVAGCLPVEGETFGLFYQLPSYWGRGRPSRRRDGIGGAAPAVAVSHSLRGCGGGKHRQHPDFGRAGLSPGAHQRARRRLRAAGYLGVSAIFRQSRGGMPMSGKLLLFGFESLLNILALEEP